MNYTNAMNTLQVPEWLPSFLTPFVTFSYPTERPAEPDSFSTSSYYGVGVLDACLIVTCIAAMAILRDFVRLGICEPFARWYLTRRLRLTKAKQNAAANGEAKSNGKANGNGCAVQADGFFITKQEARQLRHSVIRFSEQGWPAVYYTLQWAYGVYVNYNLPHALLNPIGVWINYPHIPLSGPFKFYYLTQCAFYLHQILCLNAEAHRKDHWQMMTHHIITVTLMIGSYFYNYTRVGCLVMMLMDLPDVFLPIAKMLRYLSFRTLCDLTFVCFMVSWAMTRHFLFLFVLKSAYWDAPQIIPRVWDPATGHFMTKGVWIAFTSMLVALEVIQLMWFFTILRVAYRVVSGQGAEDTRSDSEEGFSEDEGEKKDRYALDAVGVVDGEQTPKMMASFMSYFSGRRDPKQSSRDAIVTLRQQLQMIDKKQEHLNKQRDEQTNIARKNATTNRQLAATALKQRKQIDNDIEKLHSMRFQLEMQVSTLESASFNAETMAAMKKAASAMKDIHGKLDITKVDTTVADIQEQMQLANEISEAISTSTYTGVDIDEDELKRELDEMEDEQLNERLREAEHVPIHHPATQAKVAEEEDEEEQLKELQRALAM
ncbi:hypothetical protein NM688_g7963 [Phlebia brevispora]|uniref:Uncharacterized protein n=1 Tax=Phlebia brevispora TaxID=194682 RepID=A0ACC1RZ30_9APHY|nr:hypothetical protein NM688_g7963 [Phlebia brevispora]